MKKLLSLAFFICLLTQAFAQTDGITYQAVIISPDALELPGVDSENNYLPNTTIAVRFTIYDSGNQIEFQEVQITETDEFGRINLLIGDAEHDYFKEISWDGTPKDLKVEIDFDAGNNFETMSRERLTFLPFAYHRNITATGTLTVDDRTFLNGELQVEGPTNLNSTLNVNNGNATNLSGTLNVDGIADFHEALNVNNGSPATLSGDVTVGGNSLLNGTLDVIGMTTLNDLTVNGEASFGDLTAENLIINESTTLNGTTIIDGMGSQITLTSNMPDQSQASWNHPVLIDGGTNGLAIKVNGSRNNNTNFITFFDETITTSWGRIEGETPAEFTNNADYNFDQTSLNYDIYDAGFDVAFALYDLAASFVEVTAASTSSTVCVGLGTCVTAPIPSWIVSSTAQSIAAGLQVIAAGVGVGIAANNKITYDNNKEALQGVTYASGAGDYAEYLLRSDLNEQMSYGDIVGVVGGKISKNTSNAERIMVVSFKPIVLGNMPQPNREADYEKVAFMGQVPVKVFGKVSIGDYIIPSGNNDGIGIAVPPQKMTSNQINKIVGVGWEESQQAFGFSFVNTAVGINRNDSNIIIKHLENKIESQNKEIELLKNQIENILVSISEIKNGDNRETTNLNSKNHQGHSNQFDIVQSTEKDIIYFQITRDDFEKGLVMAEDMIRKTGDYDRYKDSFEKLKNDSAFKEKFFKKLQQDLEHQIHYHKEIDISGRN
ncbi:hypothetical protein FJ651_11375 [Paucihalobacter ruber]|uniref:Peptidase S74 domain-containing protein n=1 Tax=Paucihalobacter ruber TaxID=2567861 RepID=A0A506PH97_9FLAO|nr:hypothetical protein [Paucihalobacter ruber]TPV32898.1 hypothetical protein FJ651_11375 [Paucihalobacter ruber]